MPDDDKKPNTPKSGANVAPPAGAAAQSGAAAAAEGKALRFTVTATEKTGPVQPYAGVVIGDDGVGRTDNPLSAWTLVNAGYEVIDALSGKPYDGTKPKASSANA